MSVARSSHSMLGAASRGLLVHTQTTIPTFYSRAIVHQTRASSFLNDNSIPSRNRKPQTTVRDSWFARRRKQRNPRSKISTLALDPQMVDIAAEQPLQTAQEISEQSRRTDEQENSGSEKTNTKLSPRARRLIFWCALISMPIWGQDILEAVVPGILGVVIFVASNIKKGISWVKSSLDTVSPER